jgi:hypothetical protein
MVSRARGLPDTDTPFECDVRPCDAPGPEEREQRGPEAPPMSALFAEDCPSG